jgi:hypothetical protein
MSECRAVDGSEAGRWISDGLEKGPGPAVCEQIPGNFDGYLRLFHPAMTRDGHMVSWRQVSREMGSTFHARAQWNCLSRSKDRGGRRHRSWDGIPPVLGELDAQSLDVLCSILGKFTGSPDTCYFGLSTIFSRNDTSIPSERLLNVGGIREYVILVGPLTAAGELEVPTESADFGDKEGITLQHSLPDPLRASTQSGSEEHGRAAVNLPNRSAKPLEFLQGDSGQPPSLIWPSDRAWFVVSEVDFDSTLVGGSAALVEALALDERLEIERVGACDSLAADADLLNGKCKS